MGSGQLKVKLEIIVSGHTCRGVRDSWHSTRPWHSTHPGEHVHLRRAHWGSVPEVVGQHGLGQVGAGFKGPSAQGRVYS